MGYASEAAEAALGFVREITASELEEFIRQNRLKNFEVQHRALIEFRGPALAEAIETGKVVFVMFWTNVNVVSTHAFELWSKASELVKGLDAGAFGAVPCHEEQEVCKAFGISHQDHRTVYVYKDGKKYATQVGLRDEYFYAEWAEMVLNGPSIELSSDAELEHAKNGILEGFASERPRLAVTVGVFASKDSKEYQRFEHAARILNGRYHFVYRIVAGTEPSITTYRPYEQNKRVVYKEDYDSKSLLHFVTHSSVPSVLNVSRGFTSELIYRSGKSLQLLVNDGNSKLYRDLQALASRPEHVKAFLFAHVDRSVSFPLAGFLDALQMTSVQLPAYCSFEKEKVRCLTKLDDAQDLGKALANKLKDADHIVPVEDSKPHPLKYIQLEQVNSVFGAQDITVLPEPVIVDDHASMANPHNFENMDGVAVGGCPMMAHWNKDEL
ncbi:Protein R05D3.9 [Aphelenchoides avenae]|nr:Protein R05D3.9 [Aphelenchus avenae]